MDITQYTAKDIASLIKSAKEEGTPFVFFTGAGCSKSADIPLAGELVKEIKEKFPTQIKLLPEADRQDYGKCMAVLTKVERRKLIQPYIDAAKINWAHIALAALMDNGYIARVLTFNFDNMLARACGLLGLYPATYDFTSANINLHNLIVDPAIVHLHGQGYGFTQLNTGEETQEHATKLSDFVATTLNNFPSFFIGYSGLADAFFPLLKEKFCGQHRLIWANFEEEPKADVREFIDKHKNLAHYLGGVDADLFLIELAQELECFPPKLFTDPYGHLLDELKDIIDFPIKQSSADILKGLRGKLESDQRREMSESKPNLETLLMEGKYDEVIKHAHDIKLNSNEKEVVAWAYLMLGNELSDLAKERQDEQLYIESFAKYAAALDMKSDIHEALNNWGTALSELAQKNQDEHLYIESFTKYKMALDIKSDKYEALYNWGNALIGLAKKNQDESLYRESIKKYEAALKIKSDYHQALNNWGSALLDLGKKNADESLYKESFIKYQTALKIKVDKYEALSNWGNAILELAIQNSDEQLYLESFTKYEAALKIKPDFYEAWSNWGNALLGLAKQNEDVQLFKECFTKYDTALKIKPDYHEAWSNWGTALFDLTKQNEDESLYIESFTKFEEALKIKPDFYDAWSNWGTALFELAKKNEDESLYRESFAKYKVAFSIKENDYEALEGYCTVLLNFAWHKQSTEERNVLFHEAIAIAKRAEKLKPNNVYNYACVLACIGQIDACQEKLLRCEQAKTLPSNAKKHLVEDKDLESVRNLPWFQESC